MVPERVTESVVVAAVGSVFQATAASSTATATTVALPKVFSVTALITVFIASLARRVA